MTVPPGVRRVGVDADGLADLCPFHVVVDETLTVVQRGEVVARLVSGLAPGTALTQRFAVLSPGLVPGGDRALTFEALAALAAARELVQLAARDAPRLVLRGQLVLTADRAHLLFFGAPAVSDERTLAELGLTVDDFPVSSSVWDLLIASQSQAMALDEAMAMAERLQALNIELEERVAERTRTLTEANARLGDYAAELEALSGRLQEESAERARVEADLRLAHKLEAVGQLASGIAHEINTPIQFVGDNLRFLGTAFEDLDAVLGGFDGLVGALLAGEPHDAALAAVAAAVQDADLPFLREEGPRAVAESLEGIERVSQIVRAMKEFAHPDGGEPAPADLNRAVETTAIVARNEYRHVADLVTDLDPTLPPVTCVVGEINQVLLNLIVNAAHAVGDVVAETGGKGTITVSTRAEGDEVVLRVTDTGGGIPPEVQPRIFDPFFTTKEVGRGTGQGLAVCHSIVTVRHGGRLVFSTVVGTGTTFEVRLPTQLAG